MSQKLFISASTHPPRVRWQLPLDSTKKVLFCHWCSHDTWVHPSLLFETSIWGANSQFIPDLCRNIRCSWARTDV